MNVYAEILDYVRARTGLLFPSSRLANGDAGVAAAMATLGIDDVAEYLERIRVHDAAFDELIAELTVGETYFCRDADQFALVRSRIIPNILDRRGQGHTIRAWSAGCASGDEAYTLAIVFLEARLRSHIFATDISPRALLKAQEASYGSWALRGTQPEFRRRWFRKAGDRYVLEDAPRQLVGFGMLNLASAQYPSELDLILCRNVLIYFDAETIREVGARLMRALAPGGWLLLGASDPMLDCVHGVQRVSVESGIAYHHTAVTQKLDGYMPRLETETGEQMPVWATPAVEAVHVPRANERELDMEIRRLRALADAGPVAEAMDLATELIDRFPLSAHLHVLYALIMIDLGEQEVAELALRRALYLDRTLAEAHYALGALQHRRGDDVAAQRSFRNATEDRP